MDVAIVYESLFGNTREIAEAIAGGVRDADPAAQVALVRAADATAGRADGPGLLIAGGPTHMRGMSSDMTRRKGLDNEEKAAKDKGQAFHPEDGAAGPGIRDWLGQLPKARPGARAAAFDTRAGFRLAGGAARKIARGLRRRGYALATGPEGFIIEGTEGPLRAGERERARAWGAALTRDLARTA
jgi:hypothetical protein